MGQVLLPDNVPNLSRVSASQVSLPSKNGGQPTAFTVGGQQYVLGSNLVLSTGTIGAGGLDTGSIAPSTLYYVYVVISANQPMLVASIGNSSIGPNGSFTSYKLIGGFATDTTSSISIAFGANEQAGSLAPAGSSLGGGDKYIAGNLGVGTTAPGYALTVKGAYASPQTSIGYDGSNGLFLHAQGTTTHTNWLIGQQRAVSGFEITPSTAAGGTTFSSPAFVILANNNVGIGTTNPTSRLNVEGPGPSSYTASNPGNPMLVLNNTNPYAAGHVTSMEFLNRTGDNTATQWCVGVVGGAGSSQGKFFWNTTTAFNSFNEVGSISGQGSFTLGPAAFAGSHLINGRAGVGIATDGFAETLGAATTLFIGTHYGIIVVNQRASSQANGDMYMRFSDQSSVRGSISALSGGVAFNTSSDMRLKTQVNKPVDGLSLVSQLAPIWFKYANYDDEQLGFFAQEAKDVVPWAVAGSPEDDPTEKPMAMDYGRLTPVLWAAVRQLAERIEVLEASIGGSPA